METKAVYIPKKRGFWRTLWLQRTLVLMSVPFTLYYILFRYVPLTGWTMAFQNYKPQIRSTWEQEWVGFDNFVKLFTGINGERFLRVVRNTVGQSILSLVLGFFCAVVLSLLINEVKNKGFKRVIQNISYLPHFLSWIIATGLIATALALPQSGGIINIVLLNLRIIKEPIHFLGRPELFWGVVAGSNLWKSLGWNTIIYLAAMTSIDPQLYEAADMDGANRYRKMWHVSLPGIKPTIVILLIMASGNILEAGFEIQYFLGGGLVTRTSEVIDVFVLRYGIQLRDYSLATVAGMMKTCVSIVIITLVNYIAGRLGSEKLI